MFGRRNQYKEADEWIAVARAPAEFKGMIAKRIGIRDYGVEYWAAAW